MEKIAFEYRKDEPFRIVKDGCIGTIRTMEGGGVSKYIMEVRLGNIFGFDGGNYAGNVYDQNYMCPTLNTMQGGCKQPMIIDSQIVAMRGRNPDNPSDRTVGSPTEQRLEPNSQGICNTLTSVQKDNLVLENVYDFYDDKMKEDGVCGTITGACSHNGSGTFGILEKADFCIGGLQEHQTPRTDGISPSLTAAMGMGGGQTPLINCQYRIRKLTPLECWRLMDFKDEDFEKAAQVNSNTQLYKQAGNSIVKNVLVAILGQMIPGKENLYKEME